MVGTAIADSVLPAEGGIDTTQDDGHIRKVFFDQPDTLLHTWIPVGHSGGDQDRIWFDSLKETLLKHFRGDTEAVIIAIKLSQRRRFRYLSAVKLAGAEPAASSRLHTRDCLQSRIMNIQTIQQL